MKSKICTKCKYEKSLSEFYKHKDMDDELQVICKDCTKQYAIKNESRIKIYQQEYRDNHKQESKEYKKSWYQTNKEIIKEKRVGYRKNKYKTDIEYKLKTLLRSRLWNALNGRTKSKNTLKLLGCSVEELKQHLENQFKEGMFWENYGEWQVDHIKPCARFDLSKPEEQQKCFHFNNLQPLWANENRSKRDKLI